MWVIVSCGLIGEQVRSKFLILSIFHVCFVLCPLMCKQVRSKLVYSLCILMRVLVSCGLIGKQVRSKLVMLSIFMCVLVK